MRDTTGTDRLTAAIAFAADVHRGQWYRSFKGSGREAEPYLLHPLRVMLDVPAGARVVAVLHDCMEDGGRLPDWLDDDERAALMLLTRDKQRESYAKYIARLVSAEGEGAVIARRVKLADLRDNLSNDPPPALRERYGHAVVALATRSSSPPPPTAPGAQDA